MCVLRTRSLIYLIREYCLLSLRFSLISVNVSSEMVTLRTLAFGFRNDLIGCSPDCSYDKVGVPVDVSPERSTEPKAASSADSNTSLWV